MSVWSLTTAARDARRNLGPLLLILCTMVVGVAGVASLHGFRDALLYEMSQQSKELFGADLSVKLRGSFEEAHEQFLDKIPGQRVRELQFTSMAFFPEKDKTRFVVVSAVGQGYPLYGTLETLPKQAAKSFFQSNQALIDANIATQFSLTAGDTLRLGEAEFVIGGIITRIPGAIDMQSTLAPRIIISRSQLPKTSLLRRGSRVRSTEFYKLPAEYDAESIGERFAQEASELYLRFESSESRQESFQEVVGKVSTYSQLVALVAVVLGAVGAASMAHVYIRRRRRDIAVFRCLGASRSDIVWLFVLQIATAGLAGTLLGALLGVLLQYVLPYLFAEFLLVEVSLQVGWSAPLLGAGVGMLSLLAFSIVPILQVARVSPMSVLRLDASAEVYRVFEKLLFVVSGASATLLCALLVTGSTSQSLNYTGILLAVTAALILLAELGIRVVARFRGFRGPFALRQGIANISRPLNQTRVLLVVLGLGAFLVLFVSLVRVVTLARIDRLNTANDPNVVAFDIQKDQRVGVEAAARSHGLEVFTSTPMVSMRLSKVKGKSVAELLRSRKDRDSRWPLARMYRSTYRDSLDSSETLLSGKLVPEVDSAEQLVPVTLEERIARELDVEIGDRLVFDVEGVPIEVEVSGIRGVDWQQVKPNFFVVFPRGVLEDAPQMFILTARASELAQSGSFQQALVQEYSNVSVIDLQLVQQSVQKILGRLSYAAQILGLLCVVVAVVLLIATVLSTKEQRVREFQILKFLGASRKTIVLISCAEYGLISFVAVSFGAFCAFVAASLISHRYFDQSLAVFDVTSLLLAIALIIGGLVLSLLATLGTYHKPAVDLLR